MSKKKRQIYSRHRIIWNSDLHAPNTSISETSIKMLLNVVRQPFTSRCFFFLSSFRLHEKSDFSFEQYCRNKWMCESNRNGFEHLYKKMCTQPPPAPSPPLDKRYMNWFPCRNNVAFVALLVHSNALNWLFFFSSVVKCRQRKFRIHIDAHCCIHLLRYIANICCDDDGSLCFCLRTLFACILFYCFHFYFTLCFGNSIRNCLFRLP